MPLWVKVACWLIAVCVLAIVAWGTGLIGTIRERTVKLPTSLPSDKAALEILKLQHEIDDLGKPWWLRTWSWAGLLGLATLFAVLYSGILDAKRERNANEVILLEIRKDKLDETLAGKNEEVGIAQAHLDTALSELEDVREKLRIAQAFHNAVAKLSDLGFTIETLSGESGRGYRVKLPLLGSNFTVQTYRR